MSNLINFNLEDGINHLSEQTVALESILDYLKAHHIAEIEKDEITYRITIGMTTFHIFHLNYKLVKVQKSHNTISIAGDNWILKINKNSCDIIFK